MSDTTRGNVAKVVNNDVSEDMNRDSYNAIALQWDATRHRLSSRENGYLDVLIAGLSVPSPILDLGCGTGRPMAAHLLDCGHAVTGVDQASKLLDIARARYPHGRWIESRIEEFETSEQFAGVVCWDALFHVDRSFHQRVFARVANLLRDGGRFMLSVGGSAHPAFTDTMHGETFFYDSHPPDTVLRMLRELGFEMLVSEFIDLPTAGRDKGRYAIVARKP